MTLISDSRVHKAYRLYYIDLRGGKQAGMEKEREREREKNIGSNLLDGEKSLVILTHLRDTHRYRRNRLCSERKPA